MLISSACVLIYSLQLTYNVNPFVFTAILPVLLNKEWSLRFRPRETGALGDAEVSKRIEVGTFARSMPDGGKITAGKFDILLKSTVTFGSHVRFVEGQKNTWTIGKIRAQYPQQVSNGLRVKTSVKVAVSVLVTSFSVRV